MDPLQNQLNRYGRTQVILGGALMLGMVMFYLLAYRPAQQALTALDVQIDLRQRELQQSQDRAANLPILEAEVRSLEQQVAIYDRQFPRDPEFGPFIRDLTEISQRFELKQWQYRQSAWRRNDDFCELPVQLQFQGDFVSTLGFLRQVEDLHRMTRIHRLIVKSRDLRSGHVEVEAAMNIYFSEG